MFGHHGAGGHGHCAGPFVSGPCLRRGAGRGQCLVARRGRPGAIPVEHCLHLPAPLPTSEAADRQLSPQPDHGHRRAAFLRRSGPFGQAIPPDGDQRLRLCGCRIRRIPTPQFSRITGRGRRGRRIHDDEQGLQHGRLAGRLLCGQRGDHSGVGNDQGLLRLRDVPGDPGGRDRRAPRHGGGRRGPGEALSMPP